MKKSTRNIILTVALCLVVVSLFGFLTKGFTSFNVKENFDKVRNPANAIALDDISLTDGRLSNGVNVTVNKDGSVTLNGTASADLTVTYATISSLAAGTYHLTGAPKGSTGTYYLNAHYGTTDVAGDFTGGNSFTHASATETTIQIKLVKDATFFNTTLYPVLYTGDVEVEFYK